MALADHATTFPFPVTAELLERGQQRFAIFCAVCHDSTGNGNGKIVQRGYTHPPSYITDNSRGFERRGIKVRLRDVPVGYYFEVVSKGYGAMPDYAAQVPPRDRWAIIAYIRALQLSQHAYLEELPEEERQAAQKALEQNP
jgi:mono/diheme cytochrome c family protein